MNATRLLLLSVLCCLGGCLLAACQPEPERTGVPGGTLSPSPTAERTPTAPAESTPTSTPVDTPQPDGSLRRQVVLGQGILPQITYSHDGQQAFLSDGYTLRVVDAASLTELGSTPISHQGYGRIEALSPDGKWIAVVDYSTVKLISTHFHYVLTEVNGPFGPAGGLVFSPDGRSVIFHTSESSTAGSYDFICFFRLTQSALEGCYPTASYNPTIPGGPYNSMTYPAVSPDGKWVAAGYAHSASSRLYIWDLQAGTIVQEIKELPGRVLSVAFSPDGERLASAGEDGLLRLWDPETGLNVRTVSAFSGNLSKVQFSADGSQLIVQETNQPPVLYELDTERIIPAPEPEPDPLAAQMLQNGYLFHGGRSFISFSPDGKTVAVGQGSLQVWDVASHTLVAVLAAEQKLDLLSLVYSHDGRRLAAATRQGELYAWDIRSGKQEFFLAVARDSFWDHNGPTLQFNFGEYDEQGLALSPDGSQLAFSNGAAVQVWDIHSASLALSLGTAGEGLFPTRISFSPDGSVIYAAINHNQALAAWDAHTGEQMRAWDLAPVDSSSAESVALQGRWFARQFYADGSHLELWDIETGTLKLFQSPTPSGYTFRFSAGGEFLFGLKHSSSRQAQWYIWHTGAGELLFQSKQELEVDDLAVSPAGNLLATVQRGQVTLWEYTPLAGQSSPADFVPGGAAPAPSPTAPVGSCTQRLLTFDVPAGWNSGDFHSNQDRRISVHAYHPPQLLRP